MEEPIPDLIPDDLGPGNAEPRPLAILRAQANRLAAKTGSVVRAEVVPLHPADDSTVPPQSRFARSLLSRDARLYGFNLVVPALEGYTFQAFRISYPVTEAFPVKLSGALVEELAEQEEKVVEDGPRFIDALREIFSSEQFHRLVNSLLSEVSAMSA